MVRKVVPPPSTSRPGVEPAARTPNSASSIAPILTAVAGGYWWIMAPGLAPYLPGDERARVLDRTQPTLDQDDPSRGAPRLRPRRARRGAGQGPGRAAPGSGQLLQGRARAVHRRRRLRAGRMACR